MADKKAQAMERLTAKLSALRKTLRGEERKILDEMVLSMQSEVTAHSFKMRQTAGPDSQKQTKPSARLNLNSDVELHQLKMRQTPGPDSQKQTKPSARLNLNSDVELHSAQVRRITTESKTASASARKSTGPEATKISEAEGRQFLRIVLNDGNYRVTIL